MTINEYNRAKELEVFIEKSEQDSKRLRELIERIEELSKNDSQDSQSTSINIQISEKWINTPTAFVNVERLLEFLRSEIKVINDKIASYYKEFEEL